MGFRRRMKRRFKKRLGAVNERLSNLGGGNTATQKPNVNTLSGTIRPSAANPPTLANPTGVTASTVQIASPAAQQRPMGSQAPDLGSTLDIPPALKNLIEGGNLPTINLAAVNRTIPTGTNPSNKQASALDFRLQPYVFEEGGMVGPGGMPIQGGMPQPQNTMPMTPEQMEGQMAQTVQNDPQRVQALATELQNAIASGELNADQVNMGLQLAQSALQDPNLYPQLRQYAVQQGLAEEADLPMEYDEGLIFVIILGCRLALGMPVPGMGQPMQQGMPSMRSGGALPEESPNPGGGIPIMAHEGEYVIPKDVVQRKGTEFFDKLIQANNGSKVS